MLLKYSGFLSDDEIHKLVISEEINNICNKIITKSIEAKSTDNISAILTKYIAKTDWPFVHLLFYCTDFVHLNNFTKSTSIKNLVISRD